MRRSKTGEWTVEGRALTAVMGANTYRIVQYPDDSPMAGKFGVYRDGRYQAAFATMAAAKARCAGLAARRLTGFSFAGQK